MATHPLTQDRLKSLLTYDPATGVFVSLTKRKRVAANSVIGTVLTRGYLGCMLDSKRYMLHRLAWLYVYGVWPDGVVDHINHNPSDNRIPNLRVVTTQENHHNRARRTKSASGYLGVAWHKRDARWQAHIEIDGKSKYLGQFTDLALAIEARINAERNYHPSRPDHAAA